MVLARWRAANIAIGNVPFQNKQLNNNFMSKEEALKTLLEKSDTSNLEQKVDELTKKVDLLLSVIAIPQQLAADIAGVNRNTISNRAKKGQVEVLQKDGSSLNFVTIKQVSELKPRRIYATKKI